MLGACYSAKVDKYEYAVCPFGEAKQDSTRLGRMEPLVSDARDRPEGYAFRFVDGESCWNGPKRSIEVSLRCGNEPRLFRVAEPSRCEYSAVLETPAVCQEVVAEALEKELAELEKDVADLARGEEYELR
jgi:protein kinase C substrate 80K-H